LQQDWEAAKEQVMEDVQLEYQEKMRRLDIQEARLDWRILRMDERLVEYRLEWMKLDWNQPVSKLPDSEWISHVLRLRNRKETIKQSENERIEEEIEEILGEEIEDSDDTITAVEMGLQTTVSHEEYSGNEEFSLSTEMGESNEILPTTETELPLRNAASSANINATMHLVHSESKTTDHTRTIPNSILTFQKSKLCLQQTIQWHLRHASLQLFRHLFFRKEWMSILQSLGDIYLFQDGRWLKELKFGLFEGDSVHGVWKGQVTDAVVGFGWNARTIWPMSAANDLDYYLNESLDRWKESLGQVPNIIESLRFKIYLHLIPDSPQDLSSVNCIHMNPNIPVPLTYFITGPMLEKFQLIQHLVLKVLRVEEGLNRIVKSHWWSDEDASQIRLASQLKQQGYLFVGGLMRYMFTVGIEPLWKTFIQDMQELATKMETKVTFESLVEDQDWQELEQIYQKHCQTLDDICYRLLLNPKQKPLHNIMLQMLQTLLDFSSLIRGQSGSLDSLHQQWHVLHPMFIKILRGKMHRDQREDFFMAEKFEDLLLFIDGNGYFERHFL
jgi:hypothetical protein